MFRKCFFLFVFFTNLFTLVSVQFVFLVITALRNRIQINLKITKLKFLNIVYITPKHADIQMKFNGLLRFWGKNRTKTWQQSPKLTESRDSTNTFLTEYCLKRCHLDYCDYSSLIESEICHAFYWNFTGYSTFLNFDAPKSCRTFCVHCPNCRRL